MKSFKPKNKEYEEKYSLYPDTQEELIQYLENTLKINYEKLKSEEERIKSIKMIEKEYIFYLIPKGTPRPRSSRGHFYVKGAKQMKKIFDQCLKDEGIIYTRCEYDIDAYMPTPMSSMSNVEIILAEKGLILPMTTPDFDNLAKTYTDALQDVILLNDNVINPGRVKKYYSIKPRIKIKLRYQAEFDSNYNRRKTMQSIAYKRLIEGSESNG